MKTKITFEFENLEDAMDVIGYVESIMREEDAPKSGQCRYALETDSKTVPSPEMQKVYEDVISENDPVPLTRAPEQPDTKPLPKQRTRGGITGVAVKKALNEYKAANGHAEYKKILNYFGANSQRDIAKSDYPAVMQMIEQSKGNVIVADDSQAPASNPVPPQQVAEAMAPMMPTLPPQAPVATVEDMMRALGEHKARWGQQNTQAALDRFGYPNPNDIPKSEYGSMIEKIRNDNALQAGNDTGYDLSAF